MGRMCEGEALSHSHSHSHADTSTDPIQTYSFYTFISSFNSQLYTKFQLFVECIIRVVAMEGPVVATDGDGDDDDDVVENCIPWRSSGRFRMCMAMRMCVSVWLFGNRLLCSASSFLNSCHRETKGSRSGCMRLCVCYPDCMMMISAKFWPLKLRTCWWVPHSFIHSFIHSVSQSVRHSLALIVGASILHSPFCSVLFRLAKSESRSDRVVIGMGVGLSMGIGIRIGIVRMVCLSPAEQ